MIETVAIEMLTIEQFANRMKVCVKTVQNWKSSNALINGRHFLGIDGTVRFPWPVAYERIMEDLLAEGARDTNHINVGKTSKQPRRRSTAKVGAIKTPRFNPDYRKDT